MTERIGGPLGNISSDRPRREHEGGCRHAVERVQPGFRLRRYSGLTRQTFEVLAFSTRISCGSRSVIFGVQDEDEVGPFRELASIDVERRRVISVTALRI